MVENGKGRPHEQCAHLRFSIIGTLLAAPPEEPGELRRRLEELAKRTWKHPTRGEPVQYGFSTLERWYYNARHNSIDPVGALARKIRADAGEHPSVGEGVRREIELQYRAHRGWSYQLHADNLAARLKVTPALGTMPSYSSLRRYMVRHGLLRSKRPQKDRPGMETACHRLESREVRSYEAAFSNALWHLDFHHGSQKVITPEGEWVRPIALGILDDRSRVACHLQWYLAETVENLVHGLSQAFQKRGLPRMLLTDNGSAMMAAECGEGLLRLGVIHETTLPYSPYQNGKQESFWGRLEGRLVAMLESCPDLTLKLLNEATQAWAEIEYNREVHRETGQSPASRLLDGKDVGRECPGSDALRLAFTAETSRSQRRSDGTISIEGTRFEVPSRYRHLRRLCVRYARWDLTRVWLVEERTGTVLCPIYPLDRQRNADGERRRIEPVSGQPAAPPREEGIAPLLRDLMKEYASTGLPPAYIPKDDTREKK